MNFRNFLLETTENDFVQYIIESPFDDSRRLVFADWLEEQGRSDEASIMRESVKEKVFMVSRWMDYGLDEDDWHSTETYDDFNWNELIQFLRAARWRVDNRRGHAFLIDRIRGAMPEQYGYYIYAHHKFLKSYSAIQDMIFKIGNIK